MNGFVHAIRKCSKKCLVQKIGRFGSLRPIPMFQPPLDELLYNMSLEPSFSTERFPSYTRLNIGTKIIILRINPVYNALKIITINKDNTTLSLDNAKLPIIHY